MKIFFILFIFIIAARPCRAITLVGLSEGGEEIIQNIPQHEFGSSLKKRALLVYESTHEALNEFQHKQDKNNLSEGEIWDFNRFDIGIGFQASIGLGSLIKATIAPSIILHFEKR